ncbi:MAG TPA: transcriptional regulator [Candidatus Bathyarchaeia archaeon]|jgi:HTH-type transcriptional regulator/antitoxin HigA|nr:transcriptional regulator [Candidatus Bathyarchaeia archaeon]
MDIKPIKSEGDYEKALLREESLWNAPEGSAESDELDVLATLIEAYERDHYPVDLPDPVEAIKFRLEQQGKDSRALIGVIGQRTRVYEVLRGKRSLSLNMIRELHDKFGIPANVLIQPGRKSRKRVGGRASQRVRTNRLKRSL